MKDLADNSGGGGASIDDTVTANNSTWSSNKITSVISDYDTNLRGGYNGNMKDLADAIGIIDTGDFDVPAVDPLIPRCILTVNDETVSSEHGYTLDILHKVIQSSEADQYIKTGDYINLTTKNGDVFKMIFNVDTYYNDSPSAVGTSSTITTHHIDMISENLIPNASWKLRTGNGNNGTAAQPNPYLSSGESGCVMANLIEYYVSNIPSVLKNYIIKKQLVVPYRYSSKSLSSDNGQGLETLPELWIPFCREVGLNTSLTYESDMRTYPIFTDNASRIKKNASGSAARWWSASAYSVTYNGFYSVLASGDTLFANDSASDSHGVPLCFRFV